MTILVPPYAAPSQSVTEKKELPSVHSDAIKMRGEWLQGNSETAGTNAEDGKRMINIYREHGLHLIPAKKSTEANIYHMRQRIETGRLKVFNTMIMWREEYESYHRNEGKVHKEFDDLMDSTLYLLFPNFAPWAGHGTVISYRHRPKLVSFKSEAGSWSRCIKSP